MEGADKSTKLRRRPCDCFLAKEILTKMSTSTYQVLAWPLNADKNTIRKA